jgi:cytochrome c551/c552
VRAGASAFLCLVAAAVVADAREVTITLPEVPAVLRASPMPGYAIAERECTICHSPDYINFQPPGMDQAQWTGEANKMHAAFGAPITDDDIKLIGAYLAVTYGSAKLTDPGIVPLATAASGASQGAQGGGEGSGSGSAAGAGPSVQALLANHACLGCHAVDHKVVGPSFNDVAARFRSHPGAVHELSARIRSGGTGTWGTVPMPPMQDLTQAQADSLAQYVLAAPGGAGK